MFDKFLSTESLNDIAVSICKAIYRFYKLHKIPMQVPSSTNYTSNTIYTESPPSSSMSNYTQLQDEVDDY